MFSTVRADLRHYIRFCSPGTSVWLSPFRIVYTHPAAAAVVWYRFGAAVWRIRIPLVRQVLQLAYLLVMPFVRLYSGVQLQPQTKIGPGLAILHFGGVVITRGCVIGDNCLLYHNVNIVTMRSRHGPYIGNDFYAGTGATIIGNVTIGNNVTVGCNAVVTKSLPCDVVVAGVPARFIRYRETTEQPTENRTLPARPSPSIAIPAAVQSGATEQEK